MKKILILTLLLPLFVACDRNPEPERGEQGYREDQEAATAPNDYTTGEDSPPTPPAPLRN